MSVTVVIRRTLKDKKVTARLTPLIVKMRSQATIQPGFITGQTFTCLDCEGEYLVLSTWNTLEDWNKWMNSEERQEYQKKIDELTGEKTLYRYYEPVVEGILPQFNQTD